MIGALPDPTPAASRWTRSPLLLSGLRPEPGRGLRLPDPRRATGPLEPR
jgi:hypothetical protein